MMVIVVALVKGAYRVTDSNHSLFCPKSRLPLARSSLEVNRGTTLMTPWTSCAPPALLAPQPTCPGASTGGR